MKKDETRFTVRFNPADPRHRIAMDILVLSGRRKATLIADALCEYLAHHRETSAPVYLPRRSQLPINGPTCSTNTKADVFISESAGRDVEIVEKVGDDNISVNANKESLFDDDINQAILNGLSMFASSDEP